MRQQHSDQLICCNKLSTHTVALHLIHYTPMQLTAKLIGLKQNMSDELILWGGGGGLIL